MLKFVYLATFLERHLGISEWEGAGAGSILELGRMAVGSSLGLCFAVSGSDCPEPAPLSASPPSPAPALLARPPPFPSDLVTRQRLLTLFNTIPFLTVLVAIQGWEATGR